MDANIYYLIIMHVLRINKTCFVPRGQLSKCRYMQKYCFITFLKSITKSLCLAKYQNGHPNFVLVFFIDIAKISPKFWYLVSQNVAKFIAIHPLKLQKSYICVFVDYIIVTRKLHWKKDLKDWQQFQDFRKICFEFFKRMRKILLI